VPGCSPIPIVIGSVVALVRDVRAPCFRTFSEFSPTFGPKMFQKQVPLSRFGANNWDFLLRITDDTNSPVTHIVTIVPNTDATLTHVGLGQRLAAPDCMWILI